MDFRSFILSELNQKQDDKAINDVLALIRHDDRFPVSSDIKVLAEYLYLKLNPTLTTAFQKILMFWLSTQNNQTTVDPKTLELINYIINLQNNDPKYK